MYSQNKEEEVILNYFKDHSSVFFIDIGAFDGVKLSNTHQLALNGASGVCVEPYPEIYAALKSNHIGNEKVKCINFAVSDVDGEQVFYNCGIDYYGSLNEKSTHQWKKDGVIFNTSIVKTITIKSIIELNKIDKIDFISIDTEGTDFDILKQFDLKKYHVKMVCIETVDNRTEVIDYLANKGYKTIYESPQNIIAAI